MKTNLEYITFHKSELLNFEAFDLWLESDPLLRAETIAHRLYNHVMIVDNILYRYDTINVLYKEIKQPINDYLLTMTRKFIVDSYRNLTPHQQKMIYKMNNYMDVNTTFFKLDYFKDFIMDIMYLITNEIEFTTSNNKFQHYRNGYLNVKTGMFKKRNPEKHYVKEYHNEDYYVEIDDEDEETVIEPKKNTKDEEYQESVHEDQEEFDSIVDEHLKMLDL